VYFGKHEINQSTLTEFSNYFKKHSRVYLGVDKVRKIVPVSLTEMRPEIRRRRHRDVKVPNLPGKKPESDVGVGFQQTPEGQI